MFFLADGFSDFREDALTGPETFTGDVHEVFG